MYINISNQKNVMMMMIRRAQAALTRGVYNKNNMTTNKIIKRNNIFCHHALAAPMEPAEAARL
jgi:hypothetical protein